ncbi:hypothetical protein I4U23_015185 [Adineta vaga]|nr:hypothetical protein I4U23_015185 [Adineta vaga]
MLTFLNLIFFGMLFTEISSTVILSSPKPKSVATIENMTPEIYKSLLATSQLKLVRQDGNIYIPNPTSSSPKDPCMQHFYRWLNINLTYFQSWANSHCVPYRGVYGNDCTYILFQVNPQVPTCTNWWHYEDLKSIEIPEYLDYRTDLSANS